MRDNPVDKLLQDIQEAIDDCAVRAKAADDQLEWRGRFGVCFGLEIAKAIVKRHLREQAAAVNPYAALVAAASRWAAEEQQTSTGEEA